MSSASRIVIVLIAAATWLTTALFTGLPTTWESAIRPFLTALSVTSGVMWLFNKYFWRAKIFQGNLTRQPDIIGVWRVEIRSTYIDPTGQLKDPIHGFAQVDQSASSFCLRIYTSESKSKTIAYSFVLEDKVYRLAIVYDNEPAIELRYSESPAHKGSAIFNVRGHMPTALSGDYWTERKTTGTIKLFDKRRGEISSFDEGRILFKQIDL